MTAKSINIDDELIMVVDNLIAENEALQAEKERLRKALQPFADRVNDVLDNGVFMSGLNTAHDYRQAAKALKECPNE